MARGAAGQQEFARQKMLDQQKQQQQQQEMQLKTQADARAQKELENSTDRSKSEIALHNANEIAAIHEEQYMQRVRPMMEGEQADKFEAAETAKGEARVNIKKALIEAGVKPEELDKAYTNTADAPSGAAQQIGSSAAMVVHNGEKASMDEDGVGAHMVSNPAAIWNTPLKEPTKILSGYEYDDKTSKFTPKYTEVSAGTPFSTVIAMHDAAMDYLGKQQKQIADQASIAKEKAQTGQAVAGAQKDTAEARKATAEAKETEAFTGAGAGGGAASPQNIDPKTGADENYLKSLPPNLSAEVRAMGEGRTEINARMFQSKQGQQLGAALTRAYPGFDQSRAPAYFKMRNDFTSGKTSVGINSYNTGISHLGTMFDHVSGTNSLELNNPFSDVHRQLELDKQLVSTELAKAVSNGQLTEGEQKSIMNSISGATVHSYQTRIKEAVTLLHGKQEAYQEQWKNGAPPGAVSQVPIISPQAEQTISRINGNAQAAPAGGPPTGSRPVIVNGKTVGYTTDGKTMTSAQ